MKTSKTNNHRKIKHCMTISVFITYGLWCIFAENVHIFNFLWLFNVFMHAKANTDDDDGFDWCVT